VTSPATGRAGRRLYVIGVLLFAAVLVAGIAQSLRIDRHLPSIDLFGSGSREYIDLLLAEKKYAAAIEQLRMQTRLLPLEADNYEELGKLLR
jgi:hypothetical protein